MLEWKKLLDVRARRDELGVTQKQMAALLGVSLRVVQSCEQGWRKPNATVERALLLLRMTARHGTNLGKMKCWETVRCSDEQKANCMVYRCQLGHVCWLLSGNLCKARPVAGGWAGKKAVCGQCEFFAQLLDG